MEIFQSIYLVLAYLLIAKAVLLTPPSLARDVLFAGVNFAAIALVYSWGAYGWVLIFYSLIVIVQYLLCKASFVQGRSWIPALFPILVLFLLKYLPDSVYLFLGASIEGSSGPVFLGMVGLSYMAFRLSYFVNETRSVGDQMPNFFQYSAYAFFFPTLAVGPISRYNSFKETYNSPNSFEGVYDAALRVLVGAAKFLLLAAVFSQFTFDSLLMDGGKHHYTELLVACVGFYFFLYFNFSGFCDIAIGMAGILGIKIDENFNNPIAARNVQDFWNRWHMTLNAYMRDMLFTPLNKKLAHKFGIKYLNYYITASLFLVFLLIGIWHGRELQYLMFGLCHAIAVSSVNLYGIVLKKKLGVKRYKKYLESRPIRISSCFLTFAFVSGSFFIFANSPEQMSIILNSIVF